MQEKKEYLVSVVTPFHNVNMELFRQGYESLKSQTIGFSNIQWIVVLHNTEPKYHKAVHELLDRHENVIVKALDNDAHTPSSPRNCGMKLATAPYLGFLDGDDSYTPDCLETVTRRMQKTGTQIVVFRREFKAEREGLMPVTEIVLWDQTQEEIIIDREHWDDEKMFTGIWPMVTSRLFDRVFLEKHNIFFDEEVPFTEDALFLIEAYGKVDRVCYLTQFIGYRYYIHGASMMQTMGERTGAELLSYAKGWCKLFETAFQNGIYTDWTIGLLLNMLSNAMVRSQNITLADRRAIKEVLEPYVHMIPHLKINKIVTENVAKTFYEIPREVILHPENFDRGYHLQSRWNGQETLDAILKENQDTDYGRRYHFSVLRTAEGYQARVPLSHYDVYAPLVELQTRIGESAILTTDPTVCYLLSSGSMGRPRLIPATNKHLMPYLEAFAEVMQGKTTFLLAESLPMRQRYNDRAVLNSISGVTLTNFLRRERDTMQGMKAKFTSPEALLCPPEAMDTLYLRLLFALREREVEQIVAPFTWGIVEALSFLEGHWEDLCNDIEQGEVTFVLDVPDSFLRQLDGLMAPDRERAEELRSIFRQGFDLPIVPRIWPKMERIVARGTDAFRIYTKRMQRYTGDIPHLNGVMATSEMLLGKGLAGTEDYELITGAAFYEFLPFPGREDDAPLLLNQVEVGADYEVIVTNSAGFYRYRTGKLIHVKENRNGRMVFSWAGRRHEFAAIGKALLGEDEIYSAIAEAERALGLAIADFVFYADLEGSVVQLGVMLEPEEGRNGKETFSPEVTEKIRDLLDEALCRENAPYAAARQGGTPPCSLAWLQPQTQLLYRDLWRFRHKTAPDQIRPCHFLNTPARLKFFRQQMLAEGDYS